LHGRALLEGCEFELQEVASFDGGVGFAIDYKVEVVQFRGCCKQRGKHHESEKTSHS